MQKNPYKKPDRFTVAAKKAGFPARSVFKLEEIDRRARVFRQGMRVLDLGASPGSWALYAAQKVGPKGHVYAFDLAPLRTAVPANVTFKQVDAGEALKEQGTFAVVMSDMAPNTTGVRFADQAHSYELFMRALEIAEKMLDPGGTFIGKIFDGEELPLARAKVRTLFEKERVIRPEGSRTTSYEMFVIGESRVVGLKDKKK